MAAHWIEFLAARGKVGDGDTNAVNKSGEFLHLAALLAGGCIGILAVGAVAAALGIEMLGALLMYGGVLLALLVLGMVIIGLIARQ